MPLVVWTISHIFAAARFVEFMLLLTRRKGDKSLLSTQYFEQMVSRIVKLSRKKCKDKHWITSGIKTSIKRREILQEIYNEMHTKANELS